jgi:copper transport protein
MIRVVRRPLVALLLAALATVIALASGVSPASAHAELVSANPADKTNVPTAPSTANVTFSERISVDLGGVTVLDSNGKRVDEGPVRTRDGDATAEVNLKPDLPSGTYVTNFNVVSADGHPVTGAVVWGIGTGPLADMSNLEAATSTGDEAFGAVARFLTYVGALLAAGMAVFAQFIHDRGGDRSKLTAVIQAATAVAGLGIILNIIAQAALTTGEGVGAAADLDNLRKVLEAGLGWQSALLFVAMALVHVSSIVPARIVAQSLAFYGAAVTAIAFVFWGHTAASPRPWVAIPADVVHVAGVLVWIGGLVGLAVTLTGRSKLRPDELPADQRDELLASTIGVVNRFSTMAALSTIALVLAGVALTVATAPDLSNLLSIGWGRMVAVKVAVVAVVLFIAAYNRYRLLPWLLGPADDVDADGAPTPAPVPSAGDATDAAAPAPAAVASFTPIVSREPAAWRHLLATVRIELLVVVAVLAITAVLVNLTPEATATPAVPFNQTKPYGGGTAALVVTPAVAGSANAIHVNLATTEGRPATAQSITAALSLPSAGIAPISRPLLDAGTGHFLLENMSEFSVAGTWTVALDIRTSEFVTESVTFDVLVY